jgi:hypothetical protein
MKHRNNHFAIGYWSRIRQGRPAPDQAEIDPKALKRLLPFVFLLEATEDGRFIYRLAGTTLCERFGGELRGRDFLEHWDNGSRTRLQSLLRQSLILRAPLCLTSVGATEDCRMIENETLLMPITAGGKEPVRFLCVAQVLTDVASLQGRPITFERLATAKLVHEDDGIEDVSPPPPPPFIDRRGGHKRAPHLRLVSSTDQPKDALRFDLDDLFDGFSLPPIHQRINF